MKRFLLFAFTVIAFTANGQALYKCDSAKSFWTFSQENSSFSIKILGNAIETERLNVISVNNSPLQSLLVDKVNFMEDGNDNTDLKVLIRFAVSEAEHLSSVFKTKINIKLQQAPLSPDKSVLIWFFEMPSGYNKEVKFQLYANIIVEDKIFGLARPQFTDQEFEKVRDSLMDVISTLKRVSSKNDFDKLCGN